VDTGNQDDQAGDDPSAQRPRHEPTTVQELDAWLTANPLSHEERMRRKAADIAYVREHLVPGFGTDEDIAAGRRLWEDILSGRAIQRSRKRNDGERRPA
jgi:hypothetical protein